MWAVYTLATGELRYLVPDDPAGMFDMSEMGAVSFDTPPDTTTHDWDAATHSFVPALSRVAESLCAQIDAAANALIEAAVTPGAGIQAAREDKRRELDRWDAEGEDRIVNSTTYPFVVAEAEAKGCPPADVIAEIRAAVAQWLAAGTQVEALRVAGKVQVRAAPDLASMQSTAAAVLAALAGVAA